MKQQIVMVPLEELKPYDNNAKRHTPEQQELAELRREMRV